MRIAVFGGGAWGTALANLWAGTGHDVTLWARSAETVATINATHENAARLPGIALSPVLAASTDPAIAAGAELVVLAVPAQTVREAAAMIRPILPAQIPVVLCAKGIETATGALLSDVVADELPRHPPAALSGPSFAADVARGLPTAVTLAAEDEALARRLASALAAPHFRIYPSSDLTGVELGGAVKNVLAIACGICEGKALGASARAALTTRGFAELRRLAVALGAREETLSGLSGLGDLILTCNSAQSRNMSLGMALGQGKSLEEVLGSRRSVSEGVFTAAAVAARARELKIEMPICEAVHAVVSGVLDVDTAIQGLLARPAGSEAG